MFINRSVVSFILCIVNVSYAFPGEKLTVSCVSARHNAVKKVYASCHCFKNINRRAYAHKVSDFVLWRIRFNVFNDFIHFFSGFTDCKATYCVSVKVKLCNFFHMFNSQIIIYSALVNAKQHLLFIYGSIKTVKAFHFCNASF